MKFLLSQSRRRVMLTAAAAVSVAFAAPAMADYPDSSVTVLIPFSAGGGNDQVARAVAERLEERLGQPFVPVNRPGAGGFVAAQELVSGRADGYTIGHQSLGTFVLTSLMDDQVVDPLEDLRYVAQVAVLTSAVAVPTDSPYETLDDLLDAIAQSEGDMTWGHTGRGGFHHVNGVSLVRQSGGEARDVPFQGSSNTRAAMLGGQVDFAILSSLNYIGFEEEMRFLAFLAESEDGLLPDVPTVYDLGHDDMVTVETPSVWVVPADTPDEVVATLEAEIEDVVADEGYREHLLSLGITPLFASGNEVRARIDANIDGWREIIEATAAE